MKINNLFHLRLRYLHGPVTARDVTSGVTFCAMMGYLSTTVSGK